MYKRRGIGQKKYKKGERGRKPLFLAWLWGHRFLAPVQTSIKTSKTATSLLVVKPVFENCLSHVCYGAGNCKTEMTDSHVCLGNPWILRY